MRALSTSAIAIALAGTFATFIGISAPGEAKERNLAESCAHETWPYVPAYCLIGVADRPARMITMDASDASKLK